MQKFSSFQAARNHFPKDKYVIHTDAGANAALKENIADRLWAFRAGFLADCTDLPEEVFKTMLETMCENANPAVRRIVDATCGLNYIVKTAESIDGRGAYLAEYDGNEIEILVRGKPYFVYRID